MTDPTTARIALLEKRVASLEALVLDIGQILYRQSELHEKNNFNEAREIWHDERQAAIDAAREG